jgi:hypothetical protein
MTGYPGLHFNQHNVAAAGRKAEARTRFTRKFPGLQCGDTYFEGLIGPAFMNPPPLP